MGTPDSDAGMQEAQANCTPVGDAAKAIRPECPCRIDASLRKLPPADRATITQITFSAAHIEGIALPDGYRRRAGTAAVGIWAWDLCSGEFGGDRGTRAIFGCLVTNTDMRITRLSAAFHPEDRETIAQSLVDAISNESPLAAKFRVIWPDGAIRYVAICGEVCFSANGRAEYAVGLCWDVTEEASNRHTVEGVGRSGGTQEAE